MYVPFGVTYSFSTLLGRNQQELYNRLNLMNKMRNATALNWEDLGITKNAVRNVLKAASYPEGDIEAYINGKPLPYKPDILIDPFKLRSTHWTEAKES